jgi:16S rRNA C967 or C1407 C5-methylase (RsmB/RsmF family)/NOL1/NOP2/fmu family ribosome biogenesis protein
MKFPEEFIKRIESQEYIDSSTLLDAFQKPSPVSIRINNLKWNKRPVNSNPVPWSATGYYLETRPSYTLDPLYHAGCYYPQEASGMFLEHIFKSLFNTGEKLKVLDLCAAPGGKSTHLSSLIGPDGLLIANEVIRARASILAEIIIKWGTSNTIVTQSDPSDFREMTGFFDAVLVDAPCSGEGMFRDPVAIREWSVENTLLCSDRQKRILMDVWPALKEDGILIYSTCTFNPEENEKNIRWLLVKREAETVKIDISDYTGITEIDYHGITGYGFYPGKIEGEGLFIAVLKKKEKSSRKMINIRKHDDIKLRKDDFIIAGKMINITGKSLVRTGNEIIMLPTEINDFQFISQHLKIISAGTKLCTLKNKDYIPSHELALSCEIKKDAFTVVELEYNQAIAFLQRENTKIRPETEGWFILSYNDVNLGFAKNIGSRVNNYYPVNWRIRMRTSGKDKERLISWQ